MHAAKTKDDVSKAFNKFDTDGSGNIDKDELRNLSAELGHTLTSEQLDTALKDLDINGDGVIDFSEFSRWYFTGMKPYNGMTRTMLKVGKHSSSIFNALAEKTRAAFAGVLKTKTHKMSIGFNAPSADNTGTLI